MPRRAKLVRASNGPLRRISSLLWRFCTFDRLQLLSGQTPGVRKIVLMNSRIVLTLFARQALGFAWKRPVPLLVATAIHDKGGAMIRFRSQLALTLLFVIFLQPSASAQQSGTTCVTTSGWCRAVRPGPSGAPCACQTANGWVQGVLQ